MFRHTCKIIFRYLLSEVAIEAIQTKMVWRSSVLVLKYPCKSFKSVLFKDAVICKDYTSSVVLECVSVQH
jgi:hypothetical protein